MTKGEVDGELKYRTNEAIVAPMVRLVLDDGTHEVVSVQAALEKARNAKLDLVEVAPENTPPVVRIADFSEMQKQKRVREKDHAKKVKAHQRQDKAREIRITPRISSHDLELKIKKITELLEKKQKVIVVVMAPTINDKRMGQEALQYIHSVLGDKAKVRPFTLLTPLTLPQLCSESNLNRHGTVSMTFLSTVDNSKPT